MTTTELLLSAWDKDPFVIALCLAAIAGYALATRGRLRARAGYFAAAIVVFVLALASPIGVLSRDYLFSAHMLQHLLLVLIVPPLALLALPSEGAPRARVLSATPSASTRLTAAPQWLLGVGAMWLWHAPTLCDAASRSLGVHRLQTLSLVGMGAAFWWPIFAPRAKRRLAPLAAMLYLFTACIACTVLGVLVTFSPVEVCSVYAHPVDRLGALSLLREGWGLTPKADQEIGGLMMWVPACVGYAIGILAMLGRYYGEDDGPLPVPSPAEAAPTTAKEEA
jgi:putative membrane protein